MFMLMNIHIIVKNNITCILCNYKTLEIMHIYMVGYALLPLLLKMVLPNLTCKFQYLLRHLICNC